MAQNDMFVVVYKIVSYLYGCMKGGIEPDDAEWSAKALKIPEAYWIQIVSELVGHGLVAGIEIDRSTLGASVRPVAPYVTMEGVQFAQENSMMAKARAFLQDAAGIVTSFA